MEDETNRLKLLLGYFLCDYKELKSLRHQLDVSNKDYEEKIEEIQLLNEDLTSIKKEKQTLEQKIVALKEENAKLVRDIAKLEIKLKGSLSNSEQEPYSTNSNKENATDVVPTDLIDMGTSVLWRSCNLGAEKAFEVGDYFSWGALSSAEYFGNDVWGYKQVIKKNISGLNECDAALSILGEGYRIPTVKEWEELIKVCDYKPRTITIKGRKYIKLVSLKTNNQLFLPVLGHLESDVCNNEYAQYWTSEQYTGKSSYICQIHETSWNLAYAPKWNGLPIRPVFDPHTTPAILSEEDDQKEHILISSKIVTETLNKSLNSILSPRFQTITTTLNKKYPPKSKINYSNVYVELIKDCLPFGKQVFEYDNVIDIGLNLDKLNKILESVYHVKTLSPQSMARMKLKDLKTRIVSLLS